MAYFHPQFVHFAIALLVAGVVFRAISLGGWPSFVGPAAFTLLAAGTLAAVLAVQSGTAAHGPVERIPGVRAAVVDHEEWGIRTRNVFIIVMASKPSPWRSIDRLDAAWPTLRRRVSASSACCFLYEAGEHGGKLVYAYAGGVGIRSGDPGGHRTAAAGWSLQPGNG